MGCEWITHKGRKILFTDYSDCHNSKDVLHRFIEMAKEVEKSTDPVYTLDLFTGVYASKDFMKTAKEYGPMLTEKRVKGAVVGITGIKVLLFQAYLSVTNDTLVPAETKEEALAFLTEDLKS